MANSRISGAFVETFVAAFVEGMRHPTKVPASSELAQSIVLSRLHRMAPTEGLGVR
jgi:hypothetical protein